MTSAGQVRDVERKTWLTTVLASTAVAVGCCIFIGHDMLRGHLAFRFGYWASPFSVFSYEEVLMHGVTVIWRYLASPFLTCAAATYALHRYCRSSIRRTIAIALGALFGLVAAVTPTPMAHFVLDFLVSYWRATLHFIFLAVLVASVEYSSGNLFYREKRLGIVIILAGWLYVLWLSARLVGPGCCAFPSATLRLKSGQAEQYSFIAQHEIGRAHV